MPLDPIIAQGIAPIGGNIPNTLLQLQAMRGMREENKLRAQEGERNALLMRYTQEDRAAAQDRQRNEQALAHVEWALQPGVTKEMVAQTIPGIEQGFEQLHGPGSWASATDADVKNSALAARAHLSALLGKGPPVHKPLIAGTDQNVYRTDESGIPIGPPIVAGTPKQTSKLEEYQFARSQGETRPFTQWLTETMRAGAPSTSVVVNTADKFGSALGPIRAKAVSDSYDAARSARQVIDRADTVLRVLESPTITGAGADWKLGAAKVAEAAGLGGGEAVANTEVLQQQFAQAALTNYKTLGVTGSPRINKATLDFLQMASLGKISNTPEALRRIAAGYREIGEAAIKEYNDQAALVEKSNPGVLAAGGMATSLPVPADSRRLSPAEAAKLPSGTRFIGLDGVERVKK